MKTATKITAAVCAVTIAGLAALAAPSVVAGVEAMSSWAGPAHPAAAVAAHRTRTPAPAASVPSTPTPAASAGERLCPGQAELWWDDPHSLLPELSPNAVQKVTGEVVDRGPREGATGTARVDTHGEVVGYTVAANDAPMAIGARFCTDWVAILHFNSYWVTGDGKDIAPGDYLFLAPDPRHLSPAHHPTHTAPPG